MGLTSNPPPEPTINLEGLYVDINGEMWYYNPSSNYDYIAIKVLTNINNNNKGLFFDTGKSYSTELTIVKYIPKSKYPEYYL